MTDDNQRLGLVISGRVEHLETSIDALSRSTLSAICYPIRSSGENDCPVFSMAECFWSNSDSAGLSMAHAFDLFDSQSLEK
jgi:hypothetical protein